MNKGETDYPCHKPKRKGSPFIYCHSLDCEHKYGWQCGPECHEERTPCRKWRGSLTPKGYGQQWVDGEPVYVHRLRWEKRNGPIPSDRRLINVCGLRRCINPQHWRLSVPGPESVPKD